MFIQRKPKSNIEIDLEERFKDEALSDEKKSIASKAIKEQGVLNTAKLPGIGQPISVNFYNNFLEDSRFNLHNSLKQTKDLSNSFMESYLNSNKALRYMLKKAEILTSELKETEVKQSLNYKSIIHHNSFVRESDQQFIAGPNNKLLQDPLTSTTFNSRYALSTITGNGLTLPIKQSVFLPFINITRDHSDSQWGHSLIEETDPNTLLQDGIYKLVFLDRDEDSLGNVYTRSETYHVSLWFEFGGVQTINRIFIETHSNMKVLSVSFLDQNENEVVMSFNEFYSSGKINIIFDTIVARTIKVKLGLVSSTETTLFEQEFGRIYAFSVASIKAFYDTFESTGYFLSYPDEVSGLTGAKIKSNESLAEDYLIDFYLKIFHYNTSNQLIKIINIPLLEDYTAENEFSLYFLNKQAKLFYYPNTDGITVYKNGSALTAGTDYWFFTNSDSTLVSDIPVLDEYGTNSLYIKLSAYDFAAHYTCIYTPDYNAKLLGKYSYVNDTLTLTSLGGGKYQVHLFAVIRQKDSDPASLPVLVSYMLELYSERR